MQEHDAALQLARRLSHQCLIAQKAAAEAREAEAAATEKLRSYIERLQRVNA